MPWVNERANERSNVVLWDGHTFDCTIQRHTPSMKEGKGEAEKEKAKQVISNAKKSQQEDRHQRTRTLSVERDCDGRNAKNVNTEAIGGRNHIPIQYSIYSILSEDRTGHRRDGKSVTTMITDRVNNKESRNDLGREKVRGRRGGGGEQGRRWTVEKKSTPSKQCNQATKGVQNDPLVV